MTFAFPPRRMRVDAAAFYMSVSVSTFLERVSKGIYPPGLLEGGLRLWLRDDLDRTIERQFGKACDAGHQARETSDPFLQRFRKVG